VEVGQAVAALDLVDTELDLAEGVVLIFLEIGEGDLEDTALESVVGVLETSGAVYEGLSDTIMRCLVRSFVFFFCSSSSGFCSLSDSKGAGCLERVPILPGEGVDCALLETLLSLRQTLVL